MSTLLLVVIIFAGNLLLSAFFIWRGSRFFLAPRDSFSRALAAAFAICVVGVVAFASTTASQSVITAQSAVDLLIIPIAALIVTALISCVVIRSIFRTTFLRALAIWIFQQVASGVVALALVFGILRPYVLEAFMVPTNSMAPTVAGWHTNASCSHCQGLLIVPAPSPESGAPFGQGSQGICAACRKTSPTQAAASSIEAPDRILVNKLLGARRWDMVVFRYPLEPTQKYMMRLVGLPGETLFIKEGSIWINGARVEPPVELAGLRYTVEVEGGAPVKFGTAEEPLHLEHDQYCVLGDFSKRAADSRFWGSVPAGNIDGVVSLCYWPVSRWRIFR